MARRRPQSFHSWAFGLIGVIITGLVMYYARVAAKRLSGTAGWSPVAISADIEVTFGGRLYGLLSESERWRCDATLAVAIATISGLRLALLDRLDVLDLPSRSQAMTLMRAVTMDREVDSVIVAGTLKEPMAKTPDWLQAVWIEAGHIAGHERQAAA